MKSLTRKELMRERDPIIVAIGGTGAPDKVVDQYYRHLVEVSAPDVPAEDRLFALKDGGHAPLQDTYDDLATRIKEFRYKNIGRKVITLGHSQGGIHAARLGVDRLSDAVVTLAAPIRGGVTKGLPSAAGREMAQLLEDEMDPTSEFMTKLRDDMERRWPRNVPLHVIAATNDIIVSPESQFGVNLPGDHAPREFVVAPVIAALGEVGEAAARMSARAPSHVGVIYNPYPVDHFSIPKAQGLPAHLRELADELRPGKRQRGAA